MGDIYGLDAAIMGAMYGGGGGGGGTDVNAVHYTADEGKTAEQKTQARSNIGAQAENDSTLQTTAKTVSGAINELLDSSKSILNGATPPKMAVNLTTADKVNSNTSFILRTTAGDDSIANGKSVIESALGNNSTPTHTQGTATANKTEVSTASISFVAPASLTEDSYYLLYDGTNWTLGGVTVTLADYGITLTGTAYSGDAIYIVKTAGVYSAEYVSGRLTMQFTLATFLNKAEVDSMALGTYDFAYSSGSWKLSGNAVTLSDYGISVSGTTLDGDTIQVTYTSVSDYGTIAVATPQKFVSTGFNSFNPADILTGYTIDSNGNIIAQSGKFVGFAICLAGTNGWVVGHASAIDKVAYCATKPTTATTGMTILTKSNSLSDESIYGGNTYYNDGYVITNDGYIVFTGSTLDLVCTHPHWSGIANWNEGGNVDYTAYSADEVNLVGKTLTRNITRLSYTRAALNQLLAAHPSWVKGTDYSWDNNYIYHVAAEATTEAYAANSGLWSVGATKDVISVNAEVTSNDYGIEYITNTSRAPYVAISYSANLKDQLRRAARLSVPTTETYTIATSDWSALASSTPFTYSATVTAIHTIGNDTVCKLINDNAVLFATHGFAIGAVSGQSVTIYSIGQPSASVTLEVDYYG